MELEEAIEILERLILQFRSTQLTLDKDEKELYAEDIQIEEIEATKTVLQALESYKKRYELAIEQNIKDYKNSIPKKKVEDKIKELEPELELKHFEGEAEIQIRLLKELLKEE